MNRTVILAALALAGCDSILGLKDITPDGEPVTLTMKVTTTGVVNQPLGDITVGAIDILGRTVTDFTGEVHLTLGTNPSSATLLGGLTATAVKGVATFDLVGLDKPGAGYTLVATVEDLPSLISEPITISNPRFNPVATGVSGGQVLSVVVAPAAGGGTTLYAGAADGVYKSTDGASSWKASSFGGLAQGILAADPTHPGVLYLRNQYGSRLKKTVDGGANWRNMGDANFYLNTFVIDPSDPSVLYATDNSSAFRRSTDGGATWTTIATQIYCRNLVADLVTASTLYCATYEPTTGQGAGIKKSSDGGQTWAIANTGLTGPFDIGVLAATPMGVFTSIAGATYRSTNAGASWTKILDIYCYGVAYAPSMPSRVYLSASGGIAVSNNGGVTFGQPIFINGDSLQAPAVDPSNPNLAYATGNLGGIYTTTNGGTSWTVASSGIDAHAFSSVALAPGSPSTVLATTNQFSLRSTNAAASWVSSPLFNTNVHFDPVVHTRVYQCGYSYFATSNDSGATFTGGPSATLSNGCQRLIVLGTTMFSSGGGRLLKSVNSGASWTDTDLPVDTYTYDASLGDAAGNVVVAVTNTGVYRSTNAGTSFTRLADSTLVNNISQIITDPLVPTRLLAAGCGGFRISSDGGATFAANAGDGGCIQRLELTGGALYTSAYGVSPSGAQIINLTRSTDGGVTWAKTEITGVLAPFYVQSIAASDDGNAVYIATQQGLYKGSFN